MTQNVRKDVNPDGAPRASRPSNDLVWLRGDKPLPPCIEFSGSQFLELGYPHWPPDQIYLRKLHPHPAEKRKG